MWMMLTPCLPVLSGTFGEAQGDCTVLCRESPAEEDHPEEEGGNAQHLSLRHQVFLRHRSCPHKSHVCLRATFI